MNRKWGEYIVFVNSPVDVNVTTGGFTTGNYTLTADYATLMPRRKRCLYCLMAMEEGDKVWFQEVEYRDMPTYHLSTRTYYHADCREAIIEQCPVGKAVRTIDVRPTSPDITIREDIP
jgi:hypothetical protein